MLSVSNKNITLSIMAIMLNIVMLSVVALFVLSVKEALINSTGVGSGPAIKYWTRTEVVGRYKHTSLQTCSIIYWIKKFYNAGQQAFNCDSWQFITKWKKWKLRQSEIFFFAMAPENVLAYPRAIINFNNHSFSIQIQLGTPMLFDVNLGPLS